MTKKKNIFRLVFISVIITLVISCTTSLYNRKDPYPGMEILRYPASQAYVFPNESSDKLIIVIEGGGWNSVLGIKENDTWLWAGMAVQLLQELNRECVFLVPEKLKRQPGQDYSKDMEDRANYTAENILACYAESINGYLANNAFSAVVLVGSSEGGILLPLLYERINNKDNIVAMISLSCGGLSLYESITIISTTRTGYPPEWETMFSDLLAVFDPENDNFPDSFEEDYYELTYRYYKSIMHIKTFEYYKTIDIPILFTHGQYDHLIPWESTRYIQRNLSDKPFDYRYYQWGHQPGNADEVIQFRKELAEWIREHS